MSWFGDRLVPLWGDGRLAIVRNLDWSASPALLESQVIIAYAPSGEDAQPLVSVAFAGYLGCLSCMNAAGVGALFNMGYGEGHASLAEAAAGFSPANLLLRSALQARDLDGDGLSTAEDVASALTHARHAGSYIVHLVEPVKLAEAAGRSPARVLEVEAAGVTSRGPEASAESCPRERASRSPRRDGARSGRASGPRRDSWRGAGCEGSSDSWRRPRTAFADGRADAPAHGDSRACVRSRHP